MAFGNVKLFTQTGTINNVNTFNTIASQNQLVVIGSISSGSSCRRTLRGRS
jgi:hypothetical protein